MLIALCPYCYERNKGIGQFVTALNNMRIEINKLSAASRKRVTRRIYSQLRYLLCWYSEALCEANAAEHDGDAVTAAKWDEQARLYREEFALLEGTLS